uniref:C2 NT-type domain-containing protein n=1 Tax=Kalanchoe fedtschenkoi TaxID=63787 RepID=A0A7N0URN6_KALFE
MFKSKKSRADKTKFKALFQLYFQATQVPHQKRSSGLTVSLVPEDVGKPTVRLQKAPLLDGICTWESPIYETVKLVRERATGKIDEKIYYFVVSTGSSKAGFLGEVSIDFAEYVEATTPWLVPLPLTESETGPVLNVTIQRMPGEDDDKMVFREEDVSKKLDSLDRSFEDPPKDHVSLKLDSLDRQFENHVRASNASVNGAVDYQNKSSFRETSCSKIAVPLRSSVASEQVPSPHLQRENHIPQKPALNTKSTTRIAHQSSATDWSVDSFSDPNMSDSMNSPEYNYTNEVLGERSSSFSDKPKGETVTNTRHVELLELELQSLRKQVVKETKKSQDLSVKLVKLREERDAFESQCEKFKSFHMIADPEVSTSSVEELKKELNKEKYANKKLRSQLHRAQDSNSELILVVRDLKKKLDQKNTGLSHLSSKKESASCTDSDEDQEFLKESDNAKELQLLKQKLEELYGDLDTVRNEKEEVENDLKQHSIENRRLRKENRDLSSQLEQQKVRHVKMESQSSEALSHAEDLESQIGMLRIENKKQSEALTESWDTITELEAHVRSLEQELETLNVRYNEELEAATCEKDAHEQRAMKAEETLRKTKQNNATTAEKLQEEFRTLSVEMALKLDESEKIATKTQRDVDELTAQKRITEEKLQKANQELCLVRTQYQDQLQELHKEIDEKDQLIDKLSLELLDKSAEFENAVKLNGEKQEAFSMQISMLKVDIERLTKENNNLTEQVKQMGKLRDDMEELKRAVSENEISKQTWSAEINQIEERCASAKRQAQNFQEELNALSRLKDQKEEIISNLSSETEKLRAECEELKKMLRNEKSDRQDLKMKIGQLEDEVKKKEESIIKMEQQMKETRTRNNESVAANGPSRNNKSGMNIQASQEVSSLKKKVKILEDIKGAVVTNDGTTMTNASSSRAKGSATLPIQGDDATLTELRSEMALLKEKNKSMENELNDMEERYSAISLKFAEVEGERQQLVMTVRNLKNGKRL